MRPTSVPGLRGLNNAGRHGPSMDTRHIRAGIGLILLYHAVLIGGLYVGLLEPRAAVVVLCGSSVILVMMASVLGRLLLHGEL